MYTVIETAKMLKVSPLTIRRHIYRGHIHTVKVGRQHRITKEEICRIMREGYKEDLK